MQCYPRKFRVSVLNKDDRMTQVAGVPLALEAIHNDRSISLGRLVTDRYGYASFDVSDHQGTDFKVMVVGVPNIGLTLNAKDWENENGHVYLEVSPGDIPNLGAFSHLPSIQNADATDYEMSPGTFATGSGAAANSGVGRMGGRSGGRSSGNCDLLIPDPSLPYEYRFQHLVWDNKPPRPLSQFPEGKCPECIPDEQKLDKLCIRNGEILNYKVTWKFLGHSLGDLVNSFSLAPCEQIRVATLDRVRGESTSTQKDSFTQESQRESSQRDKSVRETMNSVSRERSLGFSLNLSAKLPGISFGGSISGQTARKDLTSSTQETLSETVVKMATDIRSSRSTEVVVANQVESTSLQTRVVKNNNKCHTLNLFYYEVLRHYKVKTKFDHSCKAIFVQYCPRDFKPHEVAGYAHIFKPALLDPSLADCFEALSRYLYCCKSQVVKGCQVKLNALRISMVAQLAPGILGLKLNLRDGTSVTASMPNNTSDLPPNGAPFYVPLEREICADAIVSMEMAYRDIFPIGSFSVGISSLIIEYMPSTPAISSEYYPIFSQQNMDVRISDKASWKQDLQPEIPSDEVTAARDEDCKKDKCCADRLLEHIQTNILYYNAVFWMNEDQTSRAIRFSNFNYNGQPLISQIINNPIRVVGNWVAFPEADCSRVTDPGAKGCEAIVVLPTQGIFSEGILSGCSTCETPDPSEYRDFKCDCDAQVADLPSPSN